jgi:hypothetical protein
VFTDESIDLGEVWAERVLSAIHKSTVMIILLSKDWEDSAWSFAELSAALADGGARRIIPVRLSSAVDIPPILRPYQYYNVANGGEKATIEHLADAVVKSIRANPDERHPSSPSQAVAQEPDPIDSVRWLSTVLSFVEQQVLSSPAQEQRRRLIYVMITLCATALLPLAVIIAIGVAIASSSEATSGWLGFLLGLLAVPLSYFLGRYGRGLGRRRDRS